PRIAFPSLSLRLARPVLPVMRRRRVGSALRDTSLRFVDRLRHVQRLREPRPVQPRDRIADLEPRVLHPSREPMPRAGTTEREQVPARLEDAEALTSPQRA